MEVGQRHLGGGHHPQVILHIVVKVVGELGQLGGSNQHLPLDHEGRIDLGVAVLLHMQVNHPRDEGPLKLGPQALEDVEAGAGELHPSLEINDPQSRAQLPMGQRLEVELARLALGAHYHVLALVLAHGHLLVGHVGHL